LPFTFLFDLVHRTRQRVGHLHRFGAFGVDGYGDRRESPDSVRCIGEQVLHLTPYIPQRGPVDGTYGAQVLNPDAELKTGDLPTEVLRERVTSGILLYACGLDSLRLIA